MQKPLYVIIAALYTLLSTPVFSAAEPTPPIGNQALEDLLNTLQNQTEIATSTRLNRDHVPGSVTLLHGDDLLRRGVHTVAEALQLVPGMDVIISADGQNQYMVRGIGQGFSAGKIKWLLNGSHVTAALSAATNITTIPIELIDRIEIIRGPGSALHGENAFVGLVNLVLRSSGRDLNLYSSNQKNQRQSMTLNLVDNAQTKVTANVFNLDKGGNKVTAGGDVLYSTGNPYLSGISNAPGPSNEIESQQGMILNGRLKLFNFDLFYLRNRTGDFFGLHNVLPRANTGYMREVTTYGGHIQHQYSTSAVSQLKINLEALAYGFTSGDHIFYPAGLPAVDQQLQPTVFSTDMVGSPNYNETRYALELEYKYSGWQRQQILLGLAYSTTQQGDTWARRNFDFISDPNTGSVYLQETELQERRGTENWLSENNHREVLSVVIQDVLTLDKTDFVAGLRHDFFSDVGMNTSPRLSIVHHLDRTNIVKLQYAQAFRPPNFIELYSRNNPVVVGNEEIEAETVHSTELAYIYRDGTLAVRTNVFYSLFHDLITVQNNQYINQAMIEARGLEFELSYINNHWNNDFTFTYTDSRDLSNDSPLPALPPIKSVVHFQYNFTAGTSLSATYSYMADRPREPQDPREDFATQQSTDIVLNFSRLLHHELDVSLGVKNIFDQPSYAPAMLATFNGSSLPSYMNDYPRPGREGWLRLAYSF